MDLDFVHFLAASPERAFALLLFLCSLIGTSQLLTRKKIIKSSDASLGSARQKNVQSRAYINVFDCSSSNSVLPILPFDVEKVLDFLTVSLLTPKALGTFAY